jgi:acyl carrier protein
MTPEIVDTLKNYIEGEILKRSNFHLGSSDPLISNGLIDSFHLVDLAMFIETQYNVIIDDMELNAATFDTLDELAELIRRKSE